MQSTDTTIHHLKVTQIRPRPVNRADLNLSDEFKKSIQEEGVQVPIMVRQLAKPEGGIAYEIVFGERRWAASGAVGHATVPAMIRQMDDKAAGEAQLVENLQHEGFTALDEALLYQDRIKSGDYGAGAAVAVEALAKAIKVSGSTIYARLRLLNLPKPVRDALVGGAIEASVADLIATIPDAKQQEEALKEIGKGEQVYSRGGYQTHPLSYRKAKELVEEKYRKTLKGAPFDLKQKFEGLPTCADCPKRTGNLAGLPSGSAPNVCTDPKCYVEKVERHTSALLQKHRDAGHTVIEPKEAAKLWSYGYLAASAPYLEEDFATWKGNKCIEVIKALGKKAPAPVYVVEPKSNAVRKLYPKEATVAAAVDAKLMERRASDKPETKEAKAKRLEKERLAEQQRLAEVNAILAACMNVVENPKLSDRVHALLWNYVITRMLRSDVAIAHICARRKIAPNSFEKDQTVDPSRNLHLEIVRGHAIELLISSSYEEEYDEDAMNDLAKLCGVDAGGIAKTVAAEFKEQERKAAKAHANHPVTKAKKEFAKTAAKGKAKK